MTRTSFPRSLMAAALARASAVGGVDPADEDAHAQGSAPSVASAACIRDKATGEAAVGATVVATSPALVRASRS